MLHQRCESVGGEPDQSGGAPYQLGGRSGDGSAHEPEHRSQHSEKAAAAPYDDAHEPFRVLLQRRVRLAQPHQLAHELVLELAAQLLAVDLDAGPRVASREQPVRLAHVLILDGESVRRLAPLPLREDEWGWMPGPGPDADARR